MTRKPVIRAIFKRDLRSWFTNPTGYVFITLFVLLCAFALFVPPRFFSENSASLDALSGWFRYLLLFFVPAVTMTVWAGERGQGTDEILLTLPATDAQIVFGKFLAACGIYLVSLAFTFLLPFWLDLLGEPDWGLIFSGYVSYGLLGVLLISVGMVGSQLTDNLTVAFVLSALFCAVLVFVEDLLGFVFPAILRSFTGFGPVSYFEELGRGLISARAVLFFVGLTATFLYLNLLLLSRRRWREATQGIFFSLRVVSVLVVAVCFSILVGRTGARLDVTSEGLHTLADVTREVLDEVDSSRPVTIRAWVSAEVPKEYVAARRELLDLLRVYDSRGGDGLVVDLVETERYTEAARAAERDYGVSFRTVYADEGSRLKSFDIYMGLAVESGGEVVVREFLDRGLSAEYELTRSIRVVLGTERQKIGVLDTDAKILGGMDFQTFRPLKEWEIIGELKKQYEIVSVDPDADYPDDIQMILVVAPSSLTQPQMDRLGAALTGGLPGLLLDDPLPFVNSRLAPSAPKPPSQPDMMSGGRPPPPEPKGDVGTFYRRFLIGWETSEILWDRYNPHPELAANVQPEWVFIGADSGAAEPFNESESIASGLQEVVFWFSGAIDQLPASSDANVTFSRLATTTSDSGVLPDSLVFTPGPMGRSTLNTQRMHRPTPIEYTVACRSRGKLTKATEKSFDVVMIADIDMMGLEDVWRLREQGNKDFYFDNITFVLNCVDVLAGDESFIELRKRRPRARPLTEIEEREEEFRRKWQREKEDAETEAKAELALAQKRLDDAVAAIDARTDLDEHAKSILKEATARVERRRFELAKLNVEDEKLERVERARGEMTGGVEAIQNRYRFLAVGVTPIPAVLAALFVFILRRIREAESVPAERSRLGAGGRPPSPPTEAPPPPDEGSEGGAS